MKVLLFLVAIIYSISSFAQENAENLPKEESKTIAVEPMNSPTVTPATDIKESALASSEWRLGIGASLSIYSKVDFDEVMARSGGTYMTGDSQVDLKDTLSLELEMRKVPANAWGLMLGLTYEMERDIENGYMRLNGISVPMNGKGDSIQSTIIYANAVYRWSTFYIPFGINYAFIKYKTKDAVSVKVDGGLGLQLGIGNMVNDNFVFELYSRVLAASMTSIDGSTTVWLEKGLITSLVITGKYLF